MPILERQNRRNIGVTGWRHEEANPKSMNPRHEKKIGVICLPVCPRDADRLRPPLRRFWTIGMDLSPVS